ncbi:MAG: heme ABC exporter ATP-binding protein CcmA [Thermaerobacter sp.]|nr:heme ABC exporter ATP-binding protein CcmA [Thermaerobacter sp.]
MLDGRSLRLTLGGRAILRGVDVSVGKGECLGLFGPNGAGKSTLLSLLSLQREPTSGRLSMFDGPAHVDDLALRRRLGYLGHEPGVFLGLTGYENLVFYGRLYRLDRVGERAMLGLSRVGLGPFRHEIVRNYSAGMRQRLGLARAILHSPDLLLLDEPHQSLDPQGADLLDAEIRAQCARGGAVVFASHEVSRGYQLATRLVVMRRGKVEWQAEPPAAAEDEFRRALDGVLGGRAE